LRQTPKKDHQGNKTRETFGAPAIYS